jgi:hypothetical protein
MAKPADFPTRDEIESARNTRAQLAEWGVGWPPPKGWRKKLLRVADEISGRTAAARMGDGPFPPPANFSPSLDWGAPNPALGSSAHLQIINGVDARLERELDEEFDALFD